MPAISAGLLLYRRSEADAIEVLLVHPGGPFWAKKDEHAWSIPKGLVEDGESHQETAAREFVEELGHPVPDGSQVHIGEIKKSGKTITVWVVEGNPDVSTITSNTFELEWPRGSGNLREYPEVDRADWFDLDTARTKLHKGQVPFVDRFIERILASPDF